MWPQCPDSAAPGGKGNSSFESDWHWILSLKGKEEDPEAATALGLWASQSLKVQPQGPCVPAGRQGQEHTATLSRPHGPQDVWDLHPLLTGLSWCARPAVTAHVAVWGADVHLEPRRQRSMDSGSVPGWLMTLLPHMGGWKWQVALLEPSAQAQPYSSL